MPIMTAVTLDEIFAAWDKDDGDGRDDVLTRRLSDQYVAENPDRFAKLRTFGEGRQAQDRVIKALEVFKAGSLSGDPEVPDSLDFIVECLECQVWLWHAFPPDNVGGQADIVMRNPVGG